MHCVRRIAAGSIDQLVAGTAIGTDRFAAFLNGQINARVRIPQLLLCRRTGQGKVCPADPVNGLCVGGLQAGIRGVCGVCHNGVSKNRFSTGRFTWACAYSTVQSSPNVSKI